LTTPFNLKMVSSPTNPDEKIVFETSTVPEGYSMTEITQRIMTFFEWRFPHPLHLPYKAQPSHRSPLDQAGLLLTTMHVILQGQQST